MVYTIIILYGESLLKRAARSIAARIGLRITPHITIVVCNCEVVQHLLSFWVCTYHPNRALCCLRRSVVGKRVCLIDFKVARSHLKGTDTPRLRCARLACVIRAPVHCLNPQCDDTINSLIRIIHDHIVLILYQINRSFIVGEGNLEGSECLFFAGEILRAPIISALNVSRSQRMRIDCDCYLRGCDAVVGVGLLGSIPAGHSIHSGIDQSIRFGHVVSVHVLDGKILHLIQGAEVDFLTVDRNLGSFHHRIQLTAVNAKVSFQRHIERIDRLLADRPLNGRCRELDFVVCARAQVVVHNIIRARIINSHVRAVRGIRQLH